MATLQPSAPAYLRAEYLQSPLGLGTTTPRLSWEVRDPRDGALQSAYQIVATREGKTIWDTGKVKSGQTAHISYAGEPLRAFDRVQWKVRTWDGGGAESPWSREAVLGIGPLQNSDWTAEWLTDPAEPPARMRAHNGYHSQQTRNQNETKWVQIDLGSSTPVTQVELYPTRPHDWTRDKPGFEFPVRFQIQVGDKGDGSDPVVVDKTASDFPNPEKEIARFSGLNGKGRYVRLVVTKLGEGEPGQFGFTLAEMRALNGDTVASERKKVSASDTLNTGDWHLDKLVDGDLTSHKAQGDVALRPFKVSSSIKVDKKLKRAMLYSSALGAYQVRVGDKKVTDAELSPDWTDYFQRVQYQAFDITGELKAGENPISALVGDGWYAGRIGMAQSLHPDRFYRGIYGRRPEFIAMVRLEYADGTTSVVNTDRVWRLSPTEHILSSDIYDGEAQDGRPSAVLSTAPKTRRPSAEQHLVAQRNEPIRETLRLKAISLTEPKPGVFVFDMGQNMVGKVRLSIKNVKQGSTVRLRHVEMLNDDGTVYTTNLRGAPQVDTYLAVGDGKDVFEPHFTYHGFRYVEVTGVESIKKEDITGIVFHSDSPIASTFETSDPLLNKIWQNVMWTQRANLMSTPTDCPQRDERLGWMGDILVFGQGLAYNMDVAAFYGKWLQDVRDAQADDGRFPDVAPHPFDKNRHFTGAPGWGDAGVVVPWRAYENYGDKDLLAENFEACTRWVDWIHSNNADFIWRNRRNNDYNDWLNGDTLIAEGWPRQGGSVPNEIFATIMFYNSTRLTAKMADILDKPTEARKYRMLASDIQNAFVKNFLKDDGTIQGDTQAGYSLALFYEIVPESMIDKCFAKMVAALEKYKGKMSTGFHSSHALMLELTKHGRSDLAYKLAQNREFPGWGYSVEQGATTIWERWDGYVKGRGFQDPGMNSFNHWAFGAVTEWLMKVVGGLNPGEAGEDWREFRIQPIPGGGLTWAKASYRSLYGETKTSWKVQGREFILDVVIPANTKALVVLPDGTEKMTPAGSHQFRCQLK